MALGDSDNSFLQDDRCESKLYQGVTTEVVGQCGASMYPCREEDIQNLLEYTRRGQARSL